MLSDAPNRLLYKVWQMMKDRCFNKNSTGYKWYGGRGISVCREWAESYPVFREFALSHGYEVGLQIDRKNNDGNYEPGNCRFTNNCEQVRNTSRSILHEPQVKIIKRLILDGSPNRKIADEFSVSTQLVNAIRREKIWKNVTANAPGSI